MEGKLEGFKLHHIGRAFNEAADALANMASRREQVPNGVFLEYLEKPSVPPGPGEVEPPLDSSGGPHNEGPALGAPGIMQLEAAGTVASQDQVCRDCVPEWARPFVAYLADGILPMDEAEARRLVRRAKSFVLIECQLYRRGVSGVLMRCILEEEGRKLLNDLHSGICGHYAGPRTLVEKAFR